jgi:hypothetical protein
LNLFPWAWPGALKRAAYAVANAVLLYLCLAPVSMLPKETLWDKAEHSIAWMVLEAVGLMLWPSSPRRVTAYAVALGGLVEVLQAAMPLGRDGDWHDWAADCVGVAAALVVWMGLRLIRR